MLRRRTALLLLPALAACGSGPPRQDQVALPPTAREEAGLADPARAALLSASFVFGQPSSIAGDAAAGAEALARLEFLAVELDVGPRWIGLDPLVSLAVAQGCAEARAAFGFNAAAPPQRAVDALYGAAAALREGDRAGALQALAPLTGPEGAEPALARMAAFPVLPVAARALAQARIGMHRMDRDGGRRDLRF